MRFKSNNKTLRYHYNAFGSVMVYVEISWILAASITALPQFDSTFGQFCNRMNLFKWKITRAVAVDLERKSTEKLCENLFYSILHIENQIFLYGFFNNEWIQSWVSALILPIMLNIITFFRFKRCTNSS